MAQARTWNGPPDRSGGPPIHTHYGRAAQALALLSTARSERSA